MDSRHLSALQAKHADLDEKLSAENRRPAPDEALMSQLKKQKLALKQEIAGS